MKVYKTEKRFDKLTGKETVPAKVFSHQICDFTGEKIGEYENPNAYDIDFCDNDPCFGDSKGETWIYDYLKENPELKNNYIDYRWELFATGNYKFKMEDDYKEVFQELIEAALKELDEIYSLDHLLRWSRGRMLENVIKNKKYKITDFVK